MLKQTEMQKRTYNTNQQVDSSILLRYSGGKAAVRSRRLGLFPGHERVRKSRRLGIANRSAGEGCRPRTPGAPGDALRRFVQFKLGPTYRAVFCHHWNRLSSIAKKFVTTRTTTVRTTNIKGQRLHHSPKIQNHTNHRFGKCFQSQIRKTLLST